MLKNTNFMKKTRIELLQSLGHNIDNNNCIYLVTDKDAKENAARQNKSQNFIGNTSAECWLLEPEKVGQLIRIQELV